LSAFRACFGSSACLSGGAGLNFFSSAIVFFPSFWTARSSCQPTFPNSGLQYQNGRARIVPRNV
jgi:hypothetical protein